MAKTRSWGARTLLSLQILFVAAFAGAPVTPAFAAPPAGPAAKPGAAAAPAKVKSLGETLTGQAKADYETGRVLYGDSDYAGAQIKFQAAYAASKDPRLLWNVASCQKQNRHYADAIETIKLYVAEGATVLTAKEKDEAAATLKLLEPFTIALTVEVNETGASLEIDDRVVGKTPLTAPVMVDLGQHKVRVHKDGFRDYVATTSFGGNPKQNVVVKLEKEIHEGHLSLQVPPGASIFIDGQPVTTTGGAEAQDVKLLSGGHTLRVTMPGMRVYEREVVVKDNENRVVEVLLEREAEPDKPRLKVAVGCLDAEPRGTEEGLAIYLDGSPASAVPSGGKKTWNAELGRTQIDYVEFPVDSGKHQVTVRITGCDPQETSVDVAPGEGAFLRGALESSAGFMARGPVGNPNWGRIGIALWLPHGIGAFQGSGSSTTTFTASGARQVGPSTYTPSATGVVIHPGLTFRWFTLGLELGAGGGTAAIAEDNFTEAQILAGAKERLPEVSWQRAAFRTGFRLPLNMVAWNLGISVGYDHIGLSNVPQGIPWNKEHRPSTGAWSSLDIQVLCDWAVFAGGGIDGFLKKVVNYDNSAYNLQFGIAFQPNSTCRKERGTEYGLRTGSASLTPPAASPAPAAPAPAAPVAP